MPDPPGSSTQGLWSGARMGAVLYLSEPWVGLLLPLSGLVLAGPVMVLRCPHCSVLTVPPQALCGGLWGLPPAAPSFLGPYSRPGCADPPPDTGPSLRFLSSLSSYRGSETLLTQ